MPMSSTNEILKAIRDLTGAGGRVLVGIAGAPGSGKSTYAETLAAQLGPVAAVMPMDGFHLDNETLRARDMLARKGAPETFDAQGFVELVQRLRTQGEVAYPTFDRANDRTVPSGGTIDAATQVVLIEGNYLLLHAAPWSDLGGIFDISVFLDVPRDVLRARLVQRWLDHGLTKAQAEARAEGNDLRNADLIISASRPADHVVAQA